MVKGEKLRQLGLDKAAFFGLLVLGIVIAKIFIVAKSGFNLTELISLKGTGLEVAVPSDNNWKRLSNGFKYEGRGFGFTSIMQIDDSSAISVQWVYSLLPFEKTAAKRFESKAAALKGKIESVDEKKINDINFDTAKIISDFCEPRRGGKTSTVLFCGMATLPDGRALTLEVGQKGRGADLAEKIFKTLAASIKYQPDNAVVKGAQLLKSFKNSYPNQLSEQNYQNYYRIKDTGGSTVGFTTDKIIYSAEPNSDSALSSIGLFFLSSGYNAYAEQTFFYSNASLSKFDWATKQSNLLTNREVPISIKLSDKGQIIVQKQNVVDKFPITDTMIPDVLLDLVTAAYLRSSFDTVMLDLLLSDGGVAPIIITRINSPETTVLPSASAAKVEFTGIGVNYQKTYFDGQDRPLSAEVQGNLSYRLERTTKADILADFPQWFDKIQQMEQYNREKKHPTKKS